MLTRAAEGRLVPTRPGPGTEARLMEPGRLIEPGTEARPDELPQGDVVADMTSDYVPASRQSVHRHRLGTKAGDNYCL
jgi:hypothetical protein